MRVERLGAQRIKYWMNIQKRCLIIGWRSKRFRLKVWFIEKLAGAPVLWVHFRVTDGIAIVDIPGHRKEPNAFLITKPKGL